MFDLKLERENSPIFSLTWTVIHPIDGQSPLYQMSQEDLQNSSAEIFVTSAS